MSTKIQTPHIDAHINTLKHLVNGWRQRLKELIAQGKEKSTEYGELATLIAKVQAYLGDEWGTDI